MHALALLVWVWTAAADALLISEATFDPSVCLFCAFCFPLLWGLELAFGCFVLALRWDFEVSALRIRIAKMDLNQRRPSQSSVKFLSFTKGTPSSDLRPNQTAAAFDSANLSYDGHQGTMDEFCRPLSRQLHGLNNFDREVKACSQIESGSLVNKPAMNWDPRVVLSNLSLIEQKIQQVKDIIQSIISHEGQAANQGQQQLISADLTCIILQLVSTAGTLLPNTTNTHMSNYSSVGHPGSVSTTPSSLATHNQQEDDILPRDLNKGPGYDELITGLNDCVNGEDKKEQYLNASVGEISESFPVEDHELKDYDSIVDAENLAPGSYEVLQLEKEEILAPHTHFCSICGKGFKRDANLRMHMRGHGDEYKTAAALAKPNKEASMEPTPIKRYSCPFVGCKRNKEHKKFQPLKTILCVKNHYKRSHCDKSYTCSRCGIKKFSVMADLKTHEKHCGQEKWLCSCGTTFSRKDKLFGHVALFQGHSPVLEMDDHKASGLTSQAQSNGPMDEMVDSIGYNFGASTSNNVGILDIKGAADDRDDFFSVDFGSFGGFDELAQSAFDVSGNSFFLESYSEK